MIQPTPQPRQQPAHRRRQLRRQRVQAGIAPPTRMLTSTLPSAAFRAERPDRSPTGASPRTTARPTPDPRAPPAPPDREAAAA
ncbi:MAG: hypothetical protein H6647_19975 [Anaerolineales bacterium]|nr:hypothetical protein [Anaerolineales bacterium]